MKAIYTGAKKWLPTRLQNIFSWLWQFCHYALQQFVRQRGLQIASSLAYTTLLSLVPLITVMFGFLGGLPIFSSMTNELQTFIFENFVPSFGYSIQSYLFDFSNKASKLTYTGTIVLVLIAILLMATIDNAFNKIWSVKNKRNPLARFLVYWAILTLGPLLIGIGLVATSYLLSLPAFDGVYATFGLKAKLLRIMPFLTTSIAFSILYLLVPNCYVPRRYALIGGVSAAFLFEMAKFGFGVYVKAMPSYEAIYGAVAAIPVFLIWIYLSWVIIILGAHISYCLLNFRINNNDIYHENLSWDFVAVYKIIALMWQAQNLGKKINAQDFKKCGVTLPQARIADILFILTEAKWASRSNSDQYVLLRDLSDSSVKDLYSILPCKFFHPQTSFPRDQWEISLQPLINHYQLTANEILDVPLKDLVTNIK